LVLTGRFGAQARRACQRVEDCETGTQAFIDALTA
jgi:hypothetical protein